MESDNEHDIFKEPPEVHDSTDEDSGDENSDGDTMLTHFHADSS